MRRLLITASLLAAFTLPGLAADDPIEIRETLMEGNAAAAAVAAAILKDQIAYDPAVGKSVIATLHGTALAFGSFFPAGSADPSRGSASPKIWEDPAGFAAELAKFQAATNAASDASGRSGPADKAAFATAIQPVLQTCQSCHESYRVKK